MTMPAPEAQQQTKVQQRQWLGLIAAGMLAVGAIAATVIGHQAATGDQPLSPAAQQARLLTFQQAGQMQLPPVAAGERPQAVATMNLASQPADVRQAIEDGREPLTWLTLWDDMDEDGDTVEITSHGFSRTIRLTNAPIRIAVPVPEGGVINVRGVYDGGGGITVAITTAQGRVALPVMDVGQVLGVPVRASP